jgi:hypothetical protein
MRKSFKALTGKPNALQNAWQRLATLLFCCYFVAILLLLSLIITQPPTNHAT